MNEADIGNFWKKVEKAIAIGCSDLLVPSMAHCAIGENYRKCYSRGLMATCIVSFLDLDGVRHSVEVQAEGLYEAAVLGLAAFKKHDLELSPAGLAELEVEVRRSITHTVSVQKVYQWLQQGVRSPKERVMKERLRALI